MKRLEDLQYLLMEEEDDPTAKLSEILKEKNIDEDTKEILLLLASSYKSKHEATRNTMLKIVTGIINENNQTENDEKDRAVVEKKTKMDTWLKVLLALAGTIVVIMLLLFIFSFISTEKTSNVVKMICDLIKTVGDAIRGQDIAAIKA